MSTRQEPESPIDRLERNCNELREMMRAPNAVSIEEFKDLARAEAKHHGIPFSHLIVKPLKDHWMHFQGIDGERDGKGILIHIGDLDGVDRADALLSINYALASIDLFDREAWGKISTPPMNVEFTDAITHGLRDSFVAYVTAARMCSKWDPSATDHFYTHFVVGRAHDQVKTVNAALGVDTTGQGIAFYTIARLMWPEMIRQHTSIEAPAVPKGIASLAAPLPDVYGMIDDEKFSWAERDQLLGVTGHCIDGTVHVLSVFDNLARSESGISLRSKRDRQRINYEALGLQGRVLDTARQIQDRLTTAYTK